MKLKVVKIKLEIGRINCDKYLDTDYNKTKKLNFVWIVKIKKLKFHKTLKRTSPPRQKHTDIYLI